MISSEDSYETYELNNKYIIYSQLVKNKRLGKKLRKALPINQIKMIIGLL